MFSIIVFELEVESGWRWDISSLHLERKRKFPGQPVFICCKSIPEEMFIPGPGCALAVTVFIVFLITL